MLKGYLCNHLSPKLGIRQSTGISGRVTQPLKGMYSFFLPPLEHNRESSGNCTLLTQWVVD